MVSNVYEKDDSHIVLTVSGEKNFLILVLNSSLFKSTNNDFIMTFPHMSKTYCVSSIHCPVPLTSVLGSPATFPFLIVSALPSALGRELDSDGWYCNNQGCADVSIV